MVASTSNALFVVSFFFFLLHLCGGFPSNFPLGGFILPNCSYREPDLVAFPLNLEYLEAEFFLCSVFGHGLDVEAPELTMGGPSPAGCTKAKLSPLLTDIVTQMAYQEVGHLRAIHGALRNVTGSPGFPRPKLNLDSSVFANIMTKAFGKTIAFNPYYDDLSYLVAAYAIPYVGITGYVGAMPCLWIPYFRKLVASLLAIESGQDAIIRTMLYEKLNTKLQNYGYTVAQFTQKISDLRNKLGDGSIKDEGLSVDQTLGAEGKSKGNVLAGDAMSCAYSRTPEEILAILYGTGDVSKPGGFLPNGGNGVITRSYLKKSK